MIWILLVIVWLVWSIPLAVWVGKSIGYGMGNTPDSLKSPEPPSDRIGSEPKPIA